MTIPWHASFLNSPPAQKLEIGRTKGFSVTAFTFLMHSPSETMGSSACRTRRGIGPPSWTHIFNYFQFPFYILLIFINNFHGNQKKTTHSPPCIHSPWRCTSSRGVNSHLPHSARGGRWGTPLLLVILGLGVWAGRCRCLKFVSCGCDGCRSWPRGGFAPLGSRILMLNRGHPRGRRSSLQSGRC